MASFSIFFWPVNVIALILTVAALVTVFFFTSRRIFLDVSRALSFEFCALTAVAQRLERKVAVNTQNNKILNSFNSLLYTEEG